MLCCVQSGRTALYWAAYYGYVNIVQVLVDHGAAVDLGRNEVTNLLTCGWNFGCGFIVIHASADLVYDDIAQFSFYQYMDVYVWKFLSVANTI